MTWTLSGRLSLLRSDSHYLGRRDLLLTKPKHKIRIKYAQAGAYCGTRLPLFCFAAGPELQGVEHRGPLRFNLIVTRYGCLQLDSYHLCNLRILSLLASRLFSVFHMFLFTYGTGRFIIAFTKPCYWNLHWASSVYMFTPSLCKTTYNIILPSTIRATNQPLILMFFNQHFIFLIRES